MYAHGPYRYITKHGVGPGTLPKDVNLVKWEDLDNFYTAIWTDRFLTTQELEQYDIYPETIQDPKDIGKAEGMTNCADTVPAVIQQPQLQGPVSVFESLDDADIEKLSQYKLNDAELAQLLSLFELIDTTNKAKAFELIDALLAGKELVQLTSESVCVDPVSEMTKKIREKNNSYTRRLLGDIK